MSSFLLSSVADYLFTQAGINPKLVNRAIDRSIAKRTGAWLSGNGYHARQVRLRTGVPLALICRQRGHLLISIENRSPFWSYREFSRQRCQFFTPDVLPDTVEAALKGRQLSVLAGRHPLLGHYPIVSAAKQMSMAIGQVSGTIVQLDVPWRKIV